MTDCQNAEIRDLLPDLAAERLSAAEAVRVRTHVEACVACATELQLIRSVRAVAPRVVPIDVASVVARLPRPAINAAASTDPSVVSLHARRAAARPVSGQWRARSVWRMAAAIGVIIAGGWSVVIVQQGGLGKLSVPLSDSARFATAEVHGSVALPGVSDSQAASSASSTLASAGGTDGATNAAGAAVSFGDVGNYTDEELQRVLDRLEKWDGATSTEAVTTSPILPVPGGGMFDD